MDIFFTAYRNGHSLLFIHPEEIREYDLDKDRVLTNRNVLESRSIAAPAALLVDQNDALWIGDYYWPESI
jgi:hypothetical protein